MKRFTPVFVAYKRAARDKSLSLSARGLLFLIASYDEVETIDIDWKSAESVDAIFELVDAGYIRDNIIYQYKEGEEHRLTDEDEALQKQMHYEPVPESEKHYLKTDHWKQIRKQAVKRANHCCEMCGASGVTLDVHHLTYERKGAELLEDLQVLCKPCHARVHHTGGVA